MPMPTKRHGSKKAAHEENDAEVAVPTNPNWIDKLNQAIDDLGTNRTSVREEALSNIINALTLHNSSEALDGRNRELLVLLRKSLSKGDSKESILAAKAMPLAFINHGEISLGDEEDLFQLVANTLKNTLVNSLDCDVKIQCLYSLALISFIGASDIDTQLLRDFVFDLIETGGEGMELEGISSQQIEHLTCVALRAYGLLYISTFCEGVIDFEVLWEEVEKVLPVHEILLESSEKDVRVAAGENIALMFESVRVYTQHVEEDAEETEWPEYDNMDGLIHTLHGLSVDSNRRRSKNDRAEQKSVFRDVIKSVEEGTRPEEELKISGRVLTFRGWSKILLLNAFRRAIGQGLQQHIKTNPLLRQIFHYSCRFETGAADDSDNDDPGEMSHVDKHYLYDERQKLRTKQIKSAREGKERLLA
ncbi:interferon-related developmental regulator-domain-containing protein [Phycomyces nitens]|nr:interferon-related developmental regulator-domain-containing protein [Phycomyces nitens]